MPTYNQRALSIVNAIVNGTATASQSDRLAKAFAEGLPPEATNAQISEQFIKELKQYVIERITAYEIKTGVTALRDSKAAQVPLDFADNP